MAEGLVVLSGFSLGLVTYRAVAPAAQDVIGDGDQVGEFRVTPLSWNGAFDEIDGRPEKRLDGLDSQRPRRLDEPAAAIPQRECAFELPSGRPPCRRLPQGSAVDRVQTRHLELTEGLLHRVGKFGKHRRRGPIGIAALTARDPLADKRRRQPTAPSGRA